MEAILRHCVVESLTNHCWSNAVFMAERLSTQFPNEESSRLLAEAYMSSGEYYRAYAVSKGLNGPANRYLFALAAYKLEKYQEAEQAMQTGPDGQMPNGAYGYFLLGEICRRSDKNEQAIANFKQCIALNPLIYTAYESLCQLGMDIDANHYFGTENVIRIPQITKSDGSNPNSSSAATMLMNAGGVAGGVGASFPQNTAAAGGSSSSSNPNTSNNMSFLFNRPNVSHNLSFTPLALPPPGQMDATPGNIIASPRLSFGPTVPGSVETPYEPQSRVFATPSPPGQVMNTPPAAAQKMKGPPIKKPFLSSNFGFLGSGGMIAGMKRSTRVQDPKARENERAMSKKLHLSQEATTLSISEFPSSPNVSTSTLITTAATCSPELTEGAVSLFKLLANLGNTYRHRSLYRCDEAMQCVGELPPAEQRSGFVLGEVGRALFDAGKYEQAAAVFSSMRKAEPHRIHGLEFYSTVLWFLKHENELSALAQETIAMGKYTPETWCVLGNAFSLQREFDTALKFFLRATQLDPWYAYAYTLAGHEHVSNEDFDKALACYRSAIRCDEKHFNAWHGLGTIFLKQEKFDLAEYHFRRASTCNPRNSVLQCSLGMALLANHKHKEALSVLQEAVLLDSKNALARLKRAMVLIQMQHHEEALSELEELREIAPREATVYLQMGNIHKILGNTHEALINYNQALDLDPKSSSVIKAAIDRLHIPEGLSDDSM